MGAVTSFCCGNDQEPRPRVHPSKASNQPSAIKEVSASKHPTTTPTDSQEAKPPPQLPAVPKQLPIASPVEQQPTPQPPKQQKEGIFEQLQEYFPPPPNKKINWNSFQVTHRIGGGGFGEVFLAELKENRENNILEKYAIKRVIKAEMFKSKLTDNCRLEKRILQESKCPFITTLHFAFQDETYLYFVMEWASGGDVYSLISDPMRKRVEEFKKLGEVGVRFILACLILGMEYLHKHNIMYRDLKPQNILIFENGYVKLADFGLAKESKEEDELSKTEAGTSFYYPPQMVLRVGYLKYIDLWAIGIFAYEISNYSPPFEGAEIKDKQRVKRLVEGAQKNRVWKNKDTSDELKSLINGLLKFDPKERLGYNSWNEIKSHSFFTKVDFDWSALERMEMVSPLKEIIQKHKLRPRKFNPGEPTKQAKRAEKMKMDGKDEQLQGWTYVHQEKDKEKDKK